MNVFINITTTEPVKDHEGFVSTGDTILAGVRAQKEDRHGTVKWANLAAFSSASTLFRLRRIPNIIIDTSLFIICNNERYRILNVEDVKGRFMYYEILAECIKPTGG